MTYRRLTPDEQTLVDLWTASSRDGDPDLHPWVRQLVVFAQALFAQEAGAMDNAVIVDPTKKKEKKA